MNTPLPESQFLMLLHQPHGGGPGPSPEQLRQIMERFGEWMAGMKAKGLVAGTNGLDVGGAVLRGHRGASLKDGPYSETKEIVGGYVLIHARDLNHAIELARDCPGLDYEMAIEVRPVKVRCDSSTPH